ncbi:MAG TPA: DUF916 domain-containing protein [Candidatus Saccharimonadales bacterium]|jgi:hypothetical protein
MKRIASTLSAALSVLLIAISVMPSPAATAATPLQGAPAASGPDQSSGLSIQPRKNYTINPGQTINDKINVGNLDSNSGLSLTLKVIDFTYTNQSGTPKLFLAANAPQTPWSIKSFMHLPQSVTMAPSETKTINYSITVPKNQGAGSYYSAIMYQSGEGTGGNVGLGASGVTLVFVSVPGAVNENLQLKKFGAYTSTDSGVTGAYTYIATQSVPQMIAYTLKNAGNSTEAPAGSITLKNMFGKAIGTIDKTNDTQSLALIGQTRLFSTCIETKADEVEKLGGQTIDNTGQNTCVQPQHMMPGLYTANLDIFYGQNGNQTHEITSTAHFWYLPWWFIIVMVIILALLAFGIWWLQRKIRALVKGTTYHSSSGVSRRR